MAWCELCDLDREQCEHGLAERQAQAQRHAGLRVSPRGIAHFDGCPHKGDDHDYERWGELPDPSAWQRLGNGEHPEVQDGRGERLVVTARCADCVEHGPW